MSDTAVIERLQRQLEDAQLQIRQLDNWRNELLKVMVASESLKPGPIIVCQTDTPLRKLLAEVTDARQAAQEES